MKILKKYKGNAGRKKAIAKNKFGLLDVDLVNIQKGHFPGIASAINKTEYFKNQIFSIHGEKLTVLSEYINNHTKVLVDDGIGKCLILPKNLLKGILPSIRSSIDPTSYFITKASLIHKNIYDYSKVLYVNADQLINIECKIHGEFFQCPHSHLKGSGCPICGRNKAAKNRITYTKGKENGIVYVLELREEDNTIFYKIGFTKHSVDFRYNKRWKSKIDRKRMPYCYKKLIELVYPLDIAIQKEKELHKEFGKYHYKPLKKFDGSATECYSKINYEKIIS